MYPSDKNVEATKATLHPTANFAKPMFEQRARSSPVLKDGPMRETKAPLESLGVASAE